MKKRVLMMMALLMSLGSAIASEISIADVAIPKGGQTELTISYQFDAANVFSGYNFTLTMPAGISVTNGSASEMKASGDCYTSSHVLSANYVEDSRENIYTCFSTESEYFTSTSGTLLKIKLNADASLEIGTNLSITVSDISLGKADATSEKQSNFTFNVSVVDPSDVRTVLDETSTSVPEAATGVNVKVKRTIKANTWSTICLPFAMNESQVKAAFGDDVELGDFTGYEVEEDADENVVGLKVKFNSVDISGGMEANHPYIIYVTSDITEFTADNVDIDPEEEPTVAAVKRTKKQWSEMIGVYAANTTIDEQMLVLSDNKFYYSAGSTKMKAYRAYFDFYDVLTDVEEGKAATRAFISFGDDGTTRIGNVDFLNSEDDKVYSLSGGYMGTKASLKSLPKGVYIVSGKKYIVK